MGRPNPSQNTDPHIPESQPTISLKQSKFIKKKTTYFGYEKTKEFLLSNEPKPNQSSSPSSSHSQNPPAPSTTDRQTRNLYTSRTTGRPSYNGSPSAASPRDPFRPPYCAPPRNSTQTAPLRSRHPRAT